MSDLVVRQVEEFEEGPSLYAGSISLELGERTHTRRLGAPEDRLGLLVTLERKGVGEIEMGVWKRKSERFVFLVKCDEIYLCDDVVRKDGLWPGPDGASQAQEMEIVTLLIETMYGDGTPVEQAVTVDLYREERQEDPSNPWLL